MKIKIKRGDHTHNSLECFFPEQNNSKQKKKIRNFRMKTKKHSKISNENKKIRKIRMKTKKDSKISNENKKRFENFERKKRFETRLERIVFYYRIQFWFVKPNSINQSGLNVLVCDCEFIWEL